MIGLRPWFETEYGVSGMVMRGVEKWSSYFKRLIWWNRLPQTLRPGMDGFFGRRIVRHRMAARSIAVDLELLDGSENGQYPDL